MKQIIQDVDGGLLLSLTTNRDMDRLSHVRIGRTRHTILFAVNTNLKLLTGCNPRWNLGGIHRRFSGGGGGTGWCATTTTTITLG